MQLTLVKGVFCLKTHSFSVHKVPEFPTTTFFKIPMFLFYGFVLDSVLEKDCETD